MVDRVPRAHGVRGLVVVMGAAATMLGVAMVTHSLTPLAPVASSPGQGRSLSMSDSMLASTAPPLAMPGDRAERSAVTSARTGGPPKSPLYPQNGVTLWDRIRVSSKRDRRAFLLGAAIQIHAPATAATPGPRVKPVP